MRPYSAEQRNRSRRDDFEIEPERHCDLKLIYNVPHDELVIILQPAKRFHVTRTVSSTVTMDFDEEGSIIGVQLLGTMHPSERSQELDLNRALKPFRACDNITLEDQVGYVHVRAWEPYGDEDIAYVIEAEGQFDLAHDGGLLAVHVPRNTRDYELDPFAAFVGLPWVAEVTGGERLNQFGL